MARLQTTWTAVIIMDFNLRTVHNFSKLSLEIIQLYLVKKKNIQFLLTFTYYYSAFKTLCA